MLKSYSIEYKFILPHSTPHSSYTYQKLFRALYGYSQNVTKSSGKTYLYHREGVLSGVPHIRAGKNAVLIPPSAFQALISFFKTGKNPSHLWEEKGDWKAVYNFSEKQVSEDTAATAVDSFLDRAVILNPDRRYTPLFAELQKIDAANASSNIKKEFKPVLLTRCQSICGNEWFKACCSKSKKARDFLSLYNRLRTL